MAIVCISFLCDLLLGITNPVLLLPYPAVYCMSPIFNAITIRPWIAKNIFFNYVFGEGLIVYFLAVMFNHRLFLLRNDGRKIENSPVFIACSAFLGIFLTVGIIAVQGLPFLDAEAIEREAVDEYGSGLYRLVIIFGYFAWGILFPWDSDVINHSLGKHKTAMCEFFYYSSLPFAYFMALQFLLFS
ncbi:unnamed protein product, partial [Mesorhabditis belari]|uniref:Uncharacterized protein n=1 Tax=Mesorhabditis belari TaxID=2138241 RepID=A0AAF3EZR2_9BILA